MSPQELLLHVFCLVDDELQALHLGRLRTRGPRPKLADSEVITMELVGEFWKLHTDQDLFRHFRRYHLAEFPALLSTLRDVSSPRRRIALVCVFVHNLPRER